MHNPNGKNVTIETVNGKYFSFKSFYLTTLLNASSKFIVAFNSNKLGLMEISFDPSNPLFTGKNMCVYQTEYWKDVTSISFVMEPSIPNSSPSATEFLIDDLCISFEP